jgi:cobalamin biosynthesis Mg chelatase CobN
MTSTAVDVASIPYGGFLPVHVTATEDGGAAASTGASVSATTASATTGTSTGTSTGSATVVTGTGSESSAATAAASQTESTNAAMPKITGNARWVAGGAAAALALVVV